MAHRGVILEKHLSGPQIYLRVSVWKIWNEKGESDRLVGINETKAFDRVCTNRPNYMEPEEVKTKKSWHTKKKEVGYNKKRITKCGAFDLGKVTNLVEKEKFIPCTATANIELYTWIV